ncbi:hypothetical protein UG55_1016119 [Frankia sp. EI5c]|uniref:hypothetical protein n=1 Tax=Frankia sp. EI5c TaxID=683316 RepID=UPI0007C3770B|nr:hypothetical protein [Frankia sp. EI5c]OAA26455.1 hypothetical protein UG55_1016119 [Frankia sp. EI5c]
MANFTSKVQELLHSPKAREMVDKARTVANKPENREKVRQLSSKFTGRGHGPAGAGPGTHTSGTSTSGASTPSGTSSGASSPLGGNDRGADERGPSDYGPF